MPTTMQAPATQAVLDALSRLFRIHDGDASAVARDLRAIDKSPAVPTQKGSDGLTK